MDYFDGFGKNLIRTTRLNFQNVKYIIVQINDKTATQGLVDLLNEEYPFPSYDRALEVLSSPKNENDLLIVEAALQTTIKEIKDYNRTNPKHWNEQKTSLYLYTLQYIILHLNSFKLLNSKENNYKPQIVSQIIDLTNKCSKLGLDPEIMQSQCRTPKYQFNDPDHPALSSFYFIDSEMVDGFSKRLKTYSITHKPGDLFESDLYQNYSLSSRDEAVFQKLILHMQNGFGIEKMDFKTYVEKCGLISKEIRKIFKSETPEKIQQINDAFRQYLEKKDNESIDSLVLI